MDLLGNNLRINVLNMLKELKENLDKELEGTRKIRDKREQKTASASSWRESGAQDAGRSAQRGGSWELRRRVRAPPTASRHLAPAT